MKIGGKLLASNLNYLKVLEEGAKKIYYHQNGLPDFSFFSIFSSGQNFLNLMKIK